MPDDAVEEGSVMVEESPEEDEVEELSDTHDGDESNGTDVEESSEIEPVTRKKLHNSAEQIEKASQQSF